MTLRPSRQAFQWWKNNDHPRDQIGDITLPDPKGKEAVEIEGIKYPATTYTANYRRANDWEGQVVRRFRHPGIPGSECCRVCSFPYNNHGWIDDARNGGKEYTVCPGDYIVTNPDGTYTRMSDKEFHSQHLNP